MWDLPGPQMEPMIPALAGRFLTTGPPGKPSQRSLWLFPSYYSRVSWHYWPLGQIILCCGVCSVYCGMFRGIAGFYPLEAISSHPLPIMTMKSVFRLCRISLTTRANSKIIPFPTCIARPRVALFQIGMELCLNSSLPSVFPPSVPLFQCFLSAQHVQAGYTSCRV